MKTQHKTIHDFLAEKLCFEESMDCKLEALNLWLDIIVQDYEERHSVFFDKKEREQIRHALRSWFERVHIADLRGYALFEKKTTAVRRVTAAVHNKARFLLEDQRRGRMLKEKKRNRKGGKEKEKERKKEPTGSSPKQNNLRQNIYMSGEPPTMQEYVYAPNESIELQTLRNELMSRFKIESLNDLANMVQRGDAFVFKDFIREYLHILDQSSNSFLDATRKSSTISKNART